MLLFIAAPKIIVYDNSCNLHRFCLRREPEYFARTWFAIDRMHYRGHVACHEGYNLDAYPGDEIIIPGVSLDAFNSQVAEQCNAKLDRICSQVAFMRQDNYMKHVRYYLFRCNQELKRH